MLQPNIPGLTHPKKSSDQRWKSPTPTQTKMSRQKKRMYLQAERK